MLRATISLFLSLIVLVNLPAFAVEATDDPYSCDVYVDKGGYSAPKPFSSTICPKDKALMATLYHFPSTMEAAINLTGLEYKDQIVSYLKDSRRNAVNNQSKEGQSGTTAHYQNDISNFEGSTIALRELTVWLITVIVVAQLIGLAFVAMRSGEVGGKKYGMFKTFTRISLGFILITPISVSSDVTGVSTDVLFIQILMGVAVLAALGMANVAISTTAYIMTSDVSDSQGYSSLDSTVAEGIANIASVKSRMLIEDAICANQTSLLGVYEGASLGGQGSYATLREGGAGFVYSTKDDNQNTLIEYSFDEDVVSVQTGFYLDSEHAAPLVCSESTITRPVFSLPSHVLSDDNYANLKTKIEDIANKYNLDDFKSSGGIKEDLAAIRGEVTKFLNLEKFTLSQAAENISNAVSLNTMTVDEAMTHSINYFFDLLRFRLNGGMLAEQDQDILDLFDERAKLADVFSKMLIEMKCYGYRNDYYDTENTVRALNRGGINAGSFSLKCAVVEGDRLAMPYEANTDSLDTYVADALKVATKNQSRLQDAYISLYHSFEDYDAKLEIARYDATKENAIALLKQNLTDDFDSKFSESANRLREEGIASFAYNSMGFTKLATQSLNKVVDSQFAYKVSLSDSYKASYSSETNFLPAGVGADQSSVDDFKIQVPEFIYALPEDNSNVEQLADAQLFTQQGGLFDDSGNRVDLVENSNEAVTNLIGKSQTLTLMEKSQMSVDSDFNAILSQFTGVSASLDNDELQELFQSSENYFAIVSQCGVPDAATGIKEQFGETGVKLFASVCYRYTQHYIFYAQDLGKQLINYALGMLLATGVVKTFSIATNKIKKTTDSEFEKAISEAGEEDAQTGNKATRKAKAKNKAANKLDALKDKLDVTQMAKSVINPMEFIVKVVAGIMLLVGFGLSVLVPLIPIVSHMLSYLGWLMLVFQLMVISSIIVLTFFIFTDQDDPSSSPEKAATGAYINILFRPITIVIGVVTAFMLSYVAYIMLDLTVSNMVFGLNETTDVFAYNPVKMILATLTLAVIVFSYIYVLKTIFDISLKAPNNILRKMGAETVDAREAKASAALFALVAKSSSQVSKEMNLADKINKKRVSDIIAKSREADYEDFNTINRSVGDVFTDRVNMGANAAVNSIKEHQKRYQGVAVSKKPNSYQADDTANIKATDNSERGVQSSQVGKETGVIQSADSALSASDGNDSITQSAKPSDSKKTTEDGDGK